MHWTDHWLWFAAALVFGILEIMAPGYILIGFAISAFAIGGILFFDGFLANILASSLPVALVTFGAIALLAWIAMRKIFGKRTGQAKIWDNDTDINDN